MIPIKFQVVGEEDYVFEVTIRESGEYQVVSGTYTSEPPRKGTLTSEQEEKLRSAIESFGVPESHPMPEGGEAFEAHLTIGAEGEAVQYVFWEGAMEEDEKLKTLVRLLEML